MNEILATAISLLHKDNYSLVAIHGDTIYTASGIGVKPIMQQMRTDKSYFSGFLIADKVIGKAAALLLILSGVSYVYADVMSKSAINVLEMNQIPYSNGQVVEFISNRTNTGMCPLEASVQETDDPELAFDLIEQAIAKLMAN